MARRYCRVGCACYSWYEDALYGSTIGSNNIALGYQAGTQLTSGNYNIDIGNQGTSTDSNVIRIGATGNQISTYIAGIAGTSVNGAAVLVDSSGQLGVAQSSERFKENIRNMGDASDALMELRPVTFQYKQPFEDGTQPIQYGLIGEEVAKVYPELVVYGPDKKVESVEYHQLPALLLNEVQKQHRTIQQQEEQIRSLESRLAALEASLNHKQ